MPKQYFYQLKYPGPRKATNLTLQSKLIEKALGTIKGLITQSIKIYEKHFTFQTRQPLLKKEKQGMGKAISKICPKLREHVREIRINVNGKTIISRQLFIHMTDAQIRRIKGKK